MALLLGRGLPLELRDFCAPPYVVSTPSAVSFQDFAGSFFFIASAITPLVATSRRYTKLERFCCVLFFFLLLLPLPALVARTTIPHIKMFSELAPGSDISWDMEELRNCTALLVCCRGGRAKQRSVVFASGPGEEVQY